MSIDWQPALNALNAQMLTITLRIRHGATDPVSAPSPPIDFPFFHHAIIHALMKEVARTSPPVAGIPLPGQPSGPVSRNSIPPGLIPCAIESGHASIIPGETYNVGITLVPRFAPPAASIAGTLNNLGTNPSYASRGVQLAGNFEVALVESLPQVSSVELDQQLAFLLQRNEAVIRLLSPFHAKALGGRDYVSADHFDLRAWLNAVHWRTFSLVNGRRPDQSNPAECPPSCRGMEISAQSLFDVAIPKNHPKPDERPYEIPGIIGSFTLSGLSEEWLYWLILGQYLHAGEGTGWGLGRFRIESPNFYQRFHPASTLLKKITSVHCLEHAAQHLSEVHGFDPGALPPPPDPQPDLVALAAAVCSGAYSPGQLHGFEITQHGKTRAIAVSGHADRLLQRAAVDVLGPILDSLFKQCSFGYRHGRSRADAARTISNAWSDGFRYALDADISAFFDHVNWSRLFAKLDALFPDEPLIPLLRRWVEADILYRGQTIHRSQGLPLGIAISPLLANLYLDDLDDDLGIQGFRLVRFADDFVVLTKDAESAQRAEDASRAVLARLGLDLNPDKTKIVRLEDGFSYLGYLFCRSLVIDESLSAHADHAHDPAPIVKSTWISQLRPDQLRAITPNGRLLPAFPPMEEPAPPLPLPNGQPTGPQPELPEETQAASPAKSVDSDSKPDELPAASPPSPVPDNLAVQSRWGLYVVGRETGISIHYNSLSILREGEQPVPIPVENVSHVVSIGSGRLSSPVLLALGERGIPVFFCKRSGELAGVFHPHGADRAQEDYRLWLAQSAAAQNSETRLNFARAVVAAKLARQAETLTRFATPEQRARATQIQQLALSIPTAPSLDALLGIEGSASRTNFDGIQDQLLGLTRDWPFLRRERRPPPDPVNALLSFGYTLLYIHAATALWAAGLLPQIGLVHALKPGHLSLASDLVEEFRHEVDRLVVRLINRREIRAEHFLHGPEADAGACRLTDDGRRAFILALDGVLQGQHLNDPAINSTQGQPAAMPAVRRMERQALRIRAFLSGAAPVYSGLED
jgi:group II intron reverse transcriptase/maturase/CRISPR-associated endonuclease Cas1